MNLPVATEAIGADECFLSSLIAGEALGPQLLNARHLGGTVAVVVRITAEVRALGGGHGHSGESNHGDSLGKHYCGRDSCCCGAVEMGCCVEKCSMGRPGEE